MPAPTQPPVALPRSYQSKVGKPPSYSDEGHGDAGSGRLFRLVRDEALRN